MAILVAMTCSSHRPGDHLFSGLLALSWRTDVRPVLRSVTTCPECTAGLAKVMDVQIA